MKDPFGEHPVRASRRRYTLLGGEFEFEGDDHRLLGLVDRAYKGLRPQRFGGKAPRFSIRLRLTDGARFSAGTEPPAVRMHGGGGLLGGAIDAANFSIVCPAARTGLVAISRQLLQRFPYHARYELLEFAVFNLASRAQGLAPLHAGCVSMHGRGLLLIGESGAGKSTLALMCMLQGMQLVSEDAVFVAPDGLQAAGVANFLHLRRDGLKLIQPRLARRIRRSPTIRRRSGVEKFEIDMRDSREHLAAHPPRISGLIFVSRRSASGAAVLTPLERRETIARLTASQAYASGLPSWKPFIRHLTSKAAAFELRRGKSAMESAQALRHLLLWGHGSR